MLLEPVSETAPCGPDLWLDNLGGRCRLQQPIDETIKSGEQVDWNAMCNEALDLMSASRDLRVAVLLCLTLFKTRGLAGFRDGVVLIRSLGEKFWEPLHPLPEDGDDVRSQTLSDLSALNFLKMLRDAPLCQSAGGVAYSLADIDRADSGKAPTDPAAKPFATREQIAVVFGAGHDKLRETNLTITAILEEVNTIEALAASKTDGKHQPDFSKLHELLARIDQESKVSEPGAQPPKEAGPQAASTGASAAMPGGPVRSRADVDAVLAAVCQYFRQCEPASPIPFLIDRARRMLNLDFIETLRELSPDSVERFHPLLGTKDKEKPVNSYS